MACFITILSAILLIISSSSSTIIDSKQPLQSVPDLYSYKDIMYPSPMLHELGEFSVGDATPEVIKVIKTYEVKVPVPYPVKVPHKVPYPVAYKVPQIVKVPQIIKVPHPVPVEVVKQVPVPVPVHNSEANSGSGQYDSYQPQQQVYNTVEQNYDSYQPNVQQSDWQGVPSAYGPAAYGAAAYSYNSQQQQNHLEAQDSTNSQTIEQQPHNDYAAQASTQNEAQNQEIQKMES